MRSQIIIKSTPHLIIEDEIMQDLRRTNYTEFMVNPQEMKWSQWMFNGVTEEASLRLIDCYRYHIYYLGLCKILKRLIAGEDFLLMGQRGSLSLNGVCCKLDSLEEQSRKGIYALRPQRKSHISPEKYAIFNQLVSPFEINDIQINSAEYKSFIAQSTPHYFMENVGERHGGILIINNTDYHLSIGDNKSYSIAQREEFHNRQIDILKSLIIGGDFILYPYGHSLQNVLSRISYDNEGFVSSKFRLIKTKNLPRLY